MSSDKIVDKIKKLIALGMGDPTSAEAKSAMKKAAMMMEENGISTIDLDADGNVKEASMLEKFVPSYNIHSDVWEGPIAVTLAKAFDCRVLKIRKGRGNPCHRAFLGAESDIDLAIYFYKFIRLQIQRMSEIEYKLVRDQKTYGIGCALNVIERLEEMYNIRQENMSPDTKALVLTKTKGVDDFVNEKYPRIRKGKLKSINGDQRVFAKGRQDGSKVSISKQVGNKSATGALMIG